MFAITEVPVFSSRPKPCANKRYGKPCKRLVCTFLCWQHYPQIRGYPLNDEKLITDLQKLFDLYNRASRETSTVKSKATLSISLFCAILELISLNTWIFTVRPNFKQSLLSKYREFRANSLDAGIMDNYEQVLNEKAIDIKPRHWKFPTTRIPTQHLWTFS